MTAKRGEWPVLRVLLGLLACFFLLESIFYTSASNLNMGGIMTWLVTVFLAVCTVFYHPLARFTASGAGLVLKILTLSGCAVYLGLAVFLALSAQLHPPTGTEQAIVVLGAGLHGDRISRTLRCRLDAAADYAEAHPALPVVVAGGMGRGETRTEASAMKEYLINKGMPEERILLEDRSVSTRENFLFAREVLRENGFGEVERVAFVTNRFHCYRAGLIAGRIGLQTGAVPAKLSAPAVIPSYLREVLAVLYYWLIRR